MSTIKRIGAKRGGGGNLKWTNDQKMKIASYINEHYSSFKTAGDKNGKKAQFLRQMKEEIGISGTDTQIRNVFNSMVKKYMEIRKKLNESGFGIDPEKDATLDKGWIMKQCPYYEILDQVMGTRPNVSPPYTSTSKSFGEIGCDKNSTDGNDQSFQEINSVVANEFEQEFEIDSNTGSDQEPNPKNDEEDYCIEIVTQNANGESSCQKKTDDSDLTKYIKSSFPELGSKRRVQPKNALAAFTNIMEQRMEKTNEVEVKKIKLETDKFEHMKLQHSEAHELELRKIDNDRELKLRLLDDKEKEREFELEKLKLQIELAKLQK